SRLAHRALRGGPMVRAGMAAATGWRPRPARGPQRQPARVRMARQSAANPMRAPLAPGVRQWSFCGAAARPAHSWQSPRPRRNLMTARTAVLSPLSNRLDCEVWIVGGAATALARPRAASADRVARVAIDGVDGAGKTTFADELADILRVRPTRRDLSLWTASKIRGQSDIGAVGAHPRAIMRTPSITLH